MLIIDQTRVHLDKVEGLGSFVELEVVLRDEQSTEDGEVFICFRNDPVVMPLLSLPCSLSPSFKFLLISSCGCVNACVSVCVCVCILPMCVELCGCGYSQVPMYRLLFDSFYLGYSERDYGPFGHS